MLHKCCYFLMVISNMQIIFGVRLSFQWIYIYENLHSLYMIVNDIEYLPSLITFESEQELISNMNPFLYATNDLLSI